MSNIIQNIPWVNCKFLFQFATPKIIVYTCIITTSSYRTFFFLSPLFSFQVLNILLFLCLFISFFPVLLMSAKYKTIKHLLSNFRCIQNIALWVSEQKKYVVSLCSFSFLYLKGMTQEAWLLMSVYLSSWKLKYAVKQCF